MALRVVAKNGICPLTVCDGAGSDHINLIPAALPDAPAVITITYGILGTLTLDWPIPVSTGGGDQTSIASATIVYMLEVDEGFYEYDTAYDNFVALTSYDPEGIDLYYSNTFLHENLIVGHSYTYRVKA